MRRRRPFLWLVASSCCLTTRVFRFRHDRALVSNGDGREVRDEQRRGSTFSKLLSSFYLKNANDARWDEKKKNQFFHKNFTLTLLLLQDHCKLFLFCSVYVMHATQNSHEKSFFIIMISTFCNFFKIIFCYTQEPFFLREETKMKKVNTSLLNAMKKHISNWKRDAHNFQLNLMP